MRHVPPDKTPAGPVIDPVDFLRWARARPVNETYDYEDQENCALAQYLRERGISRMPWVTPTRFQPGLTGPEIPIPEVMIRPLLAGRFGRLVRELRAEMKRCSM